MLFGNNPIYNGIIPLINFMLTFVIQLSNSLNNKYKGYTNSSHDWKIKR